MLTELTPLDAGHCIGILWCGSWRAHSAALTHINFLDENSTVMTAANDGLVRLWDEEARSRARSTLLDVVLFSVNVLTGDAVRRADCWAL
jgi:WD40 repeat protein